jgi:protoheme ferro-lyase
VRPEWVRVGAFLTWLRPSPANVVDALVNANVAALFALSELRHVSAYSAAVATVNSAIAWTQGSLRRIRMIAPYYAHPAEFFLCSSLCC